MPRWAEALRIDSSAVRPVRRVPGCRYAFPDPRRADADGLVGVGGDFEPGTIVGAYRAGLFPWPHPQEDLLWFSPDPRAIIPIGRLHVSRRLERTIRQGKFRVTVDQALRAVMDACAVRDEGTWITPRYREAYLRLHELGRVHSFEVWAGDEEELAGGLYGLAVGGLFGAESMFHRVTDASKVAMVAMMAHLEGRGFELVDVQLLTPHLASMGAVEVSRDEYLERVGAATAKTAAFTEPV